MKYLLFIIIYSILWCISVLPFSVLYFLSNIVYFLVYKVIKYRVKTVRYNLALTFPHLSDIERKNIEKDFYQHLCDLFLEMIKTITISKEELDKRFVFKNVELIKAYEQKEKSIILMLPHYGNWEWVISLGKHLDFKGFGVYKALKNKYFDKLFRDIRSRFNAELVNTHQTAGVIRENQSKKLYGVYLFLSDQTPLLRENLHWEPFMGVEVPIHMGAEVLARKLNMNILYLKVDKVKRGHYEATFSEITDDIKNEPKYKPTRVFLDKVEAQIKEAPAYYFWTHKRWKHKDEKDHFKTK
ncbi:lipid A biosynthesis acyltransferase [Flavobacterium sp. xlx-214]|uniref:lysophospholipid acyltransferase family protein n=1 Tax=unclassified Flavobacterium TaxID=196869 RepID=UPI0013D0B4EB|nr:MULTISPECIES: lipid A biosynthesis acyltransferase [unclassified Flavobacterium]MBA5791461.1 lipid A biosynthesis acyltransferase [Flavobacterium sp. xlx-221]QMI83389.1 lipid A biosynthesis acyltransferase [Flavobacterium sp. xlx-214]